MKKVDMCKYIEKSQSEENVRIQDFLENLDSKTDPETIKLQYYYFVSTKNLNEEFQVDSIDEFRNNLQA